MTNIELSAPTFQTYVTTDLRDGQPVAPTLLEKDSELFGPLDEWVHTVARPSETIERYATFQRLVATALVDGAQQELTSQALRVSPYTYINGVTCAPDKDTVIGMVRDQRMLGRREEARLSLRLDQLLESEPDRLIVGRYGFVVDTLRPDDMISRIS